MTETVSTEELALGGQIHALADAGAPARDPNAVVGAVLATPPRRRMLNRPEFRGDSGAWV